jgi:hypothetical protein
LTQSDFFENDIINENKSIDECIFQNNKLNLIKEKQIMIEIQELKKSLENSEIISKLNLEPIYISKMKITD